MMLPKIGIIIQARLGSKRLPKKILKKINHYSLIEWVVKRCKQSNFNGNIIIASPKKDELLVKEIAKKLNVKSYFGSEDNVLDRYYKAAKNYNCEAIVRICSDNPFVDSDEINHLFKEYHKDTKKKYEYFFNHRNYKKITFADGFGAELIRFNSLKKIKNKKLSKHHKEHVTAYIWDNLDKFEIKGCKTNIQKKYHSIKLDIDEYDDLKKIKKFVKKKKIKISDKANVIVSKFIKYKNYKSN
jgi:spore coat polysaccharide biosynthesis protein SpsF